MASVLKNDFSWSLQRFTMFERCKREYFYHYYGSWEGWNENAEERQEVTQVLTDIKGKPRVLDLLTRFAPQSTNTLLRRMDEEAASLRNISSSTERTIRGTVKLILPRIVISSDSFYRKIAVW